MSPLATWAVVVIVLAVSAVAAAGGVPRTVRSREIRGRAAGEGPPRRRTGAELQVVDHEVEGWFVPDGPHRRGAPREAARLGTYPLPITHRRTAA